MALTPKQQRFVEEYCANGFNATRAAISAGYKEDNAHQTAAENLKKPYIAEKIAEYKAKASQSAQITTEGVLERLAIESGYAGEHLIPEDSTASARIAALKVLGEYTGGFDSNKVKQEITGPDGGPIQQITFVPVGSK